MLLEVVVWAICAILIGYSFVEFSDYNEQKRNFEKEYGKGNDSTDVKFGHPWLGIICCAIGIIGVIYITFIK